MLKRFMFAIALIAATSGQALSIPGQTMRQLGDWGKSDAALTGFKRVFDDHAKSFKYTAALTIDHFHATFSSMPVNNVVPHEQFAFSNMPPNWDLARSWKFNARLLGEVYGASVAADALHPRTGLTAQNVAVRLGTIYAYAAVGHTLRIYRRNLYQRVVLTARACANLDCGCCLHATSSRSAVAARADNAKCACNTGADARATPRVGKEQCRVAWIQTIDG